MTENAEATWGDVWKRIDTIKADFDAKKSRIDRELLGTGWRFWKCDEMGRWWVRHRRGGDPRGHADVDELIRGCLPGRRAGP